MLNEIKYYEDKKNEEMSKRDIEIKNISNLIDKYKSLDQTVPLAYTFDATVITTVPLKDTSIEVTNTYILDPKQEIIISAFSKDSKSASLSKLLKSL